MADKISEIELIEIIAFRLFEVVNSECEETYLSWQQKPSLRREWREEAKNFIKALTLDGITNRVSSSVKARKALELMMIQPATRIYSISQDSVESNSAD